jgi:putative ABC transport system permease protein
MRAIRGCHGGVQCAAMSFIRDIRLALRLFRQTPAITAIALISVGLTVAATSVVYTAIKAVLIDPLPYTQPEQLVQFRTDFPFLTNSEQAQTDFVFWRDAQEIIRRAHSFWSIGIYGNALLDLAGDATTPPEALYGLRVSASLFPTLGVSPFLGRNIFEEEDRPGRLREMILSYGLWTRRFNADRNIVGKTVRVNGEDCLVIGVMPRQFNFPLRRQAARTPQPYVEFWTALRLDPADPDADKGALSAIGRLRPGVTMSQAQEDLASISTTLAREFPATNRDRTLRAGLMWDRTLGDARNSLWFLMGAAVTFMLIGCANVANLLLARGVVRQREVAIRLAIGARRSRIIRQFLTESCVLALFGGVAGYALTAVAWDLLRNLAPTSIPRLATARADWTVLGFTILIALANGMFFGIAPALRAIRRSREGQASNLAVRANASITRDRIRGAFVIVQVAVSVTLVVIGGQLVGNFIGLMRIDPGFSAGRVVAAVVLPSRERYDTSQKRASVYERFLNAVRAIPGVDNAGTVDALPFSGENHGAFVSLREGPLAADQIAAEIDVVSAEYLQTMGVRLVEGRWFREVEMNEASSAAIVNDVAASRLWPGAGAIGKAVCIYCTHDNPRNWRQVVGVVSSVRHAALDEPFQSNVYLSGGAFEHAQFLVARTARPAAEVEKAIRYAIAAIDPNQTVLLSGSMTSFLADSVADRRFVMSLLAVTGALALIMAAAGVYGVTLYTTSLRTQEIGIRVALGATPGKIHQLVFRQAFFSVAVGLAIGLITTMNLLRVLRGVMAGVDAGHPLHVFVAVSIVSLTAVVACWIPARRATKVDSMFALRLE